MRAGDEKNLSRVWAVCDGTSPCVRDDDGGCEGYRPSNQEQHAFSPFLLLRTGDTASIIAWITAWLGPCLLNVSNSSRNIFYYLREGSKNKERNFPMNKQLV